MTTRDIEMRLTAVERELAELKSRVVAQPAKPNDWIERIAGTFSEPEAKAAFDEAMRCGRRWRAAQRPKSHKRKASDR